MSVKLAGLALHLTASNLSEYQDTEKWCASRGGKKLEERKKFSYSLAGGQGNGLLVVVGAF